MLICIRGKDGSYQTEPIATFIQAHSSGRQLLRVFNASASNGFFLGLEYSETVEKIPIEAICFEDTPLVLGTLIIYFEQNISRSGRKRRRVNSDLIKQSTQNF